MFKTRKLITIFLIAICMAAYSCGGSSTSNEFDDQTLNDNRNTIQDNVNQSEIVLVAKITSLGTAPTYWSGCDLSTQSVTYEVISVLKGSYEGTTITIYHMLVDGSRQAGTTPEVSPELFQVGNQMIIFIQQNPDLVDLGEGWEVPRYMTFEEDFGTIPYSSQNQEVIENMIANPTAMVIDDIDEELNSFPVTDKTLTLNGAEADVQSFNNLLDACKEQSQTLSDLVSMIQNSETWTVTLNIQRNPDNVFVDSFNGRIVDIDDLEKWGAGCNDKTDLCQLFGHFLQEYWHAEVSGDGYGPSHESALDTENQIRSDLGKTTTLTAHTGVREGGNLYMSTTYDGSTELLQITGGNKPAPGDVTVRVTPPAAPAGIGADGSTHCQITVSWTDSSDNEDGFEIERRESASETWTTIIDSVPSDATSYTNSGYDPPTMSPGVEYCYRVRAFRIVNEQKVYSDYSDEACATKQ